MQFVSTDQAGKIIYTSYEDDANNCSIRLVDPGHGSGLPNDPVCYRPEVASPMKWIHREKAHMSFEATGTDRKDGSFTGGKSLPAMILREHSDNR